MSITNNINIYSIEPILSPAEVKEKYTISESILASIKKSRHIIRNILNKTDPRMLVIIGPCSIHDERAANEYSNKLAALLTKYPNIYIVMRVYFEKPRTVSGWKGLIMDPDLDNSCDIHRGLHLARKIMVNIAGKGIPMACEFLDTISAQYISDIVSYGAIGARTTQSQLHRQMSAGLSVPVGFKNTTDGNIEVALNSILAARVSQSFLGIDDNGIASIVKTRGNDCHLILRGGKEPNYTAPCVKHAIEKSRTRGIHSGIIIDCSHGNSNKDYRNQKKVLYNVCHQRLSSNNIVGVMIESNIHQGSQTLVNKKDLMYGISITDSCISFEESVVFLEKLNICASFACPDLYPL